MEINTPTTASGQAATGADPDFQFGAGAGAGGESDSARRSNRRRRFLLIGGVLCALVVVGALVVLSLRGGSEPGDPDEDLARAGPPPSAVQETAQALSGDAEAQREALAPELLDAIEADENTEPSLLPPGATLQLDEDGWRSEIDGYGGATGQVLLEDGSSIRVMVGFAETDGTWRVVYMADLTEEAEGE